MFKNELNYSEVCTYYGKITMITIKAKYNILKHTKELLHIS